MVNFGKCVGYFFTCDDSLICIIKIDTFLWCMFCFEQEELSMDGNLSLINLALQQLTVHPSSEPNILLRKFYDDIRNSKTEIYRCEKYSFEEYLKKLRTKFVKNACDASDENFRCKKLKTDKDPEKLHQNITDETYNCSAVSEVHTLDVHRSSDFSTSQVSHSEFLNCIVSKDNLSVIYEQLTKLHYSKSVCK